MAKTTMTERTTSTSISCAATRKIRARPRASKMGRDSSASAKSSTRSRAAGQSCSSARPGRGGHSWSLHACRSDAFQQLGTWLTGLDQCLEEHRGAALVGHARAVEYMVAHIFSGGIVVAEAP